MARNFTNWLDSYVKYATDTFCPPQFHLWTGLSILAGALERKVWVEQHLEHTSLLHYPNLYVLLISHPSVGKTTAMDRGTEFLERLKFETNPDFKFIPNQATEPHLVEAMKVRQAVQVGSIVVYQSAGYFYASEASSSALQNTCGNFVATLTAFYDCPRFFKKGLKGEDEETIIPNVCFNVLAGSTFDYLRTLVNEESALGGFASRCIYVVSKDRKVRTPKWQKEKSIIPTGGKMADKLFADLQEIHKLIGVFIPTDGFIKKWEAWQPKFDEYLIGLNSPRLEGIFARKSTNLMKVCMLLSAAESDDLILTEKHWEKALELMDEVTKDNSFVLSSAVIANVETQAGIKQFILQVIQNNAGKMKLSDLKSSVSQRGSDFSMFDPTIKFLSEAGHIRLVIDRGIGYIELLIDPDTCL